MVAPDEADYCSKEASTCTEYISIRSKLRNNSAARLCVELKGTHSTLRYYSNSPAYEPTTPRPDSANYHDPQCHTASTVTAEIIQREVSDASCAQTTRPWVIVTVPVDDQSTCCAHSWQGLRVS